MEVKIGNTLAKAWIIDPSPTSERPDWVIEAMKKGSIGWADEGGKQSVMGKWFDKQIDDASLELNLSHQLKRPKTFWVRSYLFPVVAYAGDLLLYSEKFPEKFKIMTQKEFNKLKSFEN